MRKDAHTTVAIAAGPSEVDGVRIAVDIASDHDRRGITIRPTGARVTDRVCDAIEAVALRAMDRCPVSGQGTIVIDVSEVECLPATAPRVFARIAAAAGRAGYTPAFYGARAVVMDQIRIFGIDRSYRMHFPGGPHRAA